MLSKLMRLSGLFLVLAGLLAAISWIFHPLTPDQHSMQSTRWLIVHGLAGIGVLLSVPGLVGLYVRLSDEGGVLGLIGFILAAIGTALFAGAILFIEVGTLPFIATLGNAEELLESAPPTFIAIFAATFITFAVGFILLGLVTLRSTILPRWAGLLLLIGAPLFVFPVPPAPVIVNTIGAVLFGLGYVWLGYALWTDTSSVTEAETRFSPAA
jgi:hypothetical protein